ncbi:hypothetical protein ASF10_12985 [Flavobacterium sp. Leaf82]|uniref:hypothetical protein n=1 Tax=unclassified Flavobacterium TaxID=196869 RepID=UPI000700B1D7|nr:hypothetical protein [Flavobacterium sp. Leaf82]KQO21659.1 hypothetical protein ASF10_12985 [Flavobacterium sp. Leaf82]
MSKNSIHNFDLSIKNTADIKSSEELTKAIIKELAKVSKEMSQQKDIMQEWQEQNNQNTTAIEEGAANTNAETIKKTATSDSNTSSVFGETTSTALIGGGVTDNNGIITMGSSVSGNITPPRLGAENNTLNFSSGITTQTYAGVAANQTLEIPQTKSNEPTLEVIKAEIKKKLDAAIAIKNTEEIAYWRQITKAFKKGATAQDFNGKKDHELFSKMYFGLQKWRLATIDEPAITNINWGDVSELMILKLLQLSDEETNENLRVYYNRMIKEIKNPDINIQKLFSEHDELFLLLKSVFPNLPGKVTIQTQKIVYPNLSPQKMYPNIGLEDMYFIWSGTLLDDIEIKYGTGEIGMDIFWNYAPLKIGQWYDYDRINPTKEGSTFWDASLYNTLNGQHYLYHTIAQRHAYYQFVDAYLKTKGIISEWFDAAARVTMGSILTAIDGEMALGGPEMPVNLWFLTDKTDDFLKGGNKYLFADNMNNVKLLLEGKGRLSGEFIDAKGNKQSFENLSQEELDFKLVEFEQTLVQDYINSSFKDLNNSFLKKSLDEVSSTTGNKEFDTIVREINDNFTIWMAPDIIEDIMEKYFTTNKKITFNFAKYDDRVKLGQIMVKELYYLKLSDTFKVDTLDKILEKPFERSIKTTEYFRIDQELAVKEKPKHLKEYKLLQRLIRINNKLNKKSDGSHEVDKIIDDLKDISKKEIKKSAVNIKKEIKTSLISIIAEIKNSVRSISEEINNSSESFNNVVSNDLLKLYNEIKKEVEIQRPHEPYDMEYFDLIKKLYDDINEIREKLQEKIGQKVHKTVDKIEEKVGKTVDNIGKEVNHMRDEIAEKALVKFAKRLHPGVDKLSDNQKKSLFETSYEDTVAILLYEFAEGVGPKDRIFDFCDHKFAQAILSNWLIREIMEETLKLLRQTNYDFVNRPDSKDLKLNIEFSPTPTYSIEALDKHLNSNLAQIFIGGGFALVRIRGGKLEGYIYNETSKESLMLHLTVGDIERKDNEKQYQKMSTIIQRIYFTFELPQNSK